MLAALPIVRASEAFVVVDKPSGLLSVPGRGDDKKDCVAARVQAAFPGATGPLIAHRLDMETSGLMVLGLTPAAQRDLSMQFEARSVDKRYVALVEGRIGVRRARGRIALPLRLDPERRPLQVVDHERGRAALTCYRVLGYGRRPSRGGRACTRVEFSPETGRSHQLRVHAAHPEGLGAPILGDGLYGDPSGADRLLLHATHLAFNDPATGARIACRSEAPF